MDHNQDAINAKTSVKHTISKYEPFNITLEDDDRVFEHLTPADVSASRLTMYEKSIKSLPQPPALWSAFQRACDKGASSQKLGEIIHDDPVLSAAILRIANAPGLGVRTPIYDVGRAIAHLGTTLVRTIVSRHAFSGTLNKAKVYDIQKLWKHGMAVSALAEIIAEHIPGCNDEEASALGLFHDIGKMSMNLFTQFMQPATLDLNQGHLQYEHQRFSCTHIDTGVLLAKHWALPEKIVRGISFHHHPAYADVSAVPEDIRPVVFAVFLADMLAIRLGFDTNDTGIVLPHESYAPLLPKTTLMDIMNSPKVIHEMNRIESIQF